MGYIFSSFKSGKSSYVLMEVFFFFFYKLKENLLGSYQYYLEDKEMDKIIQNLYFKPENFVMIIIIRYQ